MYAAPSNAEYPIGCVPILNCVQCSPRETTGWGWEYCGATNWKLKLDCSDALPAEKLDPPFVSCVPVDSAESEETTSVTHVIIFLFVVTLLCLFSSFKVWDIKHVHRRAGKRRWRRLMATK
jgi:hypothetical protein